MKPRPGTRWKRRTRREKKAREAAKWRVFGEFRWRIERSIVTLKFTEEDRYGMSIGTPDRGFRFSYHHGMGFTEPRHGHQQ